MKTEAFVVFLKTLKRNCSLRQDRQILWV